MSRKIFVLFGLVFFSGLIFCDPIKGKKETGLKPPVTVYYSPEVVLQGLDEFKELNGKLQAYADSEMEKFERRVSELEKKSKGIASVNPAKRAEEAAEIAKEKNAIAIDQRAAQMEIENRGRQMQGKVMSGMEKAVEDVRKSNGYDVVDHKDRMCCVSTKYDVTSKIIDTMNKDHKKEKAAKKFQKSAKLKAA